MTVQVSPLELDRAAVEELTPSGPRGVDPVPWSLIGLRVQSSPESEMDAMKGDQLQVFGYRRVKGGGEP